MIRVSKLADYAVVILSVLSRRDSDLVSAGDIAQEAGVPEPTAGKVLKMLVHAGIITSVRGAGGGYRMVRGADDISIADIVTAIDGPIALTACAPGSNTTCDIASCCPVNGRWRGVNNAIVSALKDVHLSDMVPIAYHVKQTEGRQESLV